MQNILVEKKALRAQMKKLLLQNATLENRDRAHYHLSQQLLKHKDFQQSQVILLYAALPTEVPTQALIAHYARTKTILLPVVQENELVLRIYNGESSLQKNRWDILEPVGKNFTDLETIEFALIPGLAFDLQRYRLGRGKGYYDKLLSNPRLKKMQKWGVGFDIQLLTHVPLENHDIPLDDVIII